MKANLLILSTALLALAACSDNGDVLEPKTQPDISAQQPITFNTFNRNVTRAQRDLQETNHYNFGIWAYKENSTTDNQKVMDNYLVGYCDGVSKGYDPSQSKTWASVTGSQTDYKSPWFYDALGKNQYTYNGNAGYYTAANTEYMSGNDEQYLSYWDRAYAKTNFWYYAPYRANGVNFDYNSKKLSVTGDNVIHESYVNPLNPALEANSTPDFLYGTKTVNKDSYRDVATLSMTHGGAQVLIAFYSDADAYKYRAEIIDFNAGWTRQDGKTDYTVQGVQANPAGCNIDDAGKVALIGTSKTKYLTDGTGMTIDFSGTDPVVTPGVGGDPTDENLRFRIPIEKAPVNISNHEVEKVTAYTDNAEHLLIPTKAPSTAAQKYAYSPTLYNAVPQSQTFNDLSTSDPTAGFMFHISFRFYKETSNGWELEHTVYNAKAYVPPYVMVGGVKKNLTQWEPNKRYIYIFKIVPGTNGTIIPDNPDPDIPTPDDPDPDDPTPDPSRALPAIVIDSVQVDEMQNSTSAEFTSNGKHETIPVLPVDDDPSHAVDPDYGGADL